MKKIERKYGINKLKRFISVFFLCWIWSNIQEPIAVLGSGRKSQVLHVLQVVLGNHLGLGFRLCLGLLSILDRPSLQKLLVFLEVRMFQHLQLGLEVQVDLRDLLVLRHPSVFLHRLGLPFLPEYQILQDLLPDQAGPERPGGRAFLGVLLLLSVQALPCFRVDLRVLGFRVGRSCTFVGVHQQAKHCRRVQVIRHLRCRRLFRRLHHHQEDRVDRRFLVGRCSNQRFQR